MGLRATVIKKYEIEYGNTQGFNYSSDVMASLIYEFCDDYFVGDDGCGGSNTDSIWEVSKDDFTYMLNEIKEMSQKELDDIMGQHWDKDDIIRVFEGFLKETPENSNYVRFGWL